ncbi:MAG TPA: response regulator [Anaerolineales bacterium]|nr:response regulator [Anaerolineales bacterium]
MDTNTGPILVVEDVPNILELLKITLNFKGYQVMTARDGQEALEQIEKTVPALVITDILMPIMDGFAFVQKLRTDPKTIKIPVVFLSATYLTPEDKAFAMSLGASCFIEKPIDTEEFLLTIAELLTKERDTSPRPMDQHEFYLGYRDRLESKLRHKNAQLARTQRLLTTLPDDQKEAYQALFEQSTHDRDAIETELKEIYKMIDNSQK